MNKLGITTAAALAALAAVCVWGAVGDVISSFRWSGITVPYAAAIYRDDTYVYGFFHTASDDYLRRYTPAGSLVGSVKLAGSELPYDADHSTLGAGYVTVVDVARDEIMDYVVASGSLVRSVGVIPASFAYGYFPAASHYYVTNAFRVFRYTTAGSLVGSFWGASAIGGLGMTPRFNGRAGEYVVVSPNGPSEHTRVFNSSGSLLASYLAPGGAAGGVCGPGAPASWGITYWCNVRLGLEYYAYQFDIGGTEPAVAPASLGRVKALFR